MKGKVLLIGPIILSYGGVSRFIEDLLKSGIDYEFIHFDTARPPKQYSSPIDNGYKEVFSAGLGRSLVGIIITFWHVLKLPYFLYCKSPDIVHIASVTYWVFWESAAYLLISKIAGIKVVFHMLGPFDIFYKKSNGKIKLLIRAILRKSNTVVCLSDRDKELMSTFLLPENISVLRSNVRIPHDQVVHSNRRGREKINILFMGGINPYRKGIYDILKALPIVVNTCKNIKLIFTGGGNMELALNQALDPDLFHWISHIGWVSETEKWTLYQAADLLILPSYEEGLPYVIIEAMLSGLPVISTSVGGIPEVVKDGVNGFLINPGDYKSLADRIIYLCCDEQLRLSIGNSNREEAQLLYSQEIIFRELEDIYDKLIERQ